MEGVFQLIASKITAVSFLVRAAKKKKKKFIFDKFSYTVAVYMQQYTYQYTYNTFTYNKILIFLKVEEKLLQYMHELFM